MTVTVCIPAYRAGGFIAQTVGAVLQQSHRDLKVVVAIDPPADGCADDTAAALAPLMSDRRLCVRLNPERLGWAENVNSLVRDIRTPLFCFLPHDDIWSPLYLEAMLAALDARPEAIIAYCDILRFGATGATRKSVIIPRGADRVTALLHFLIQGTEAQMWRGVTRASVLERVGGFPTDQHKGFVVECEYSLALLGAGPACHVPRTMYFKRIYDRDVISASRERMMFGLEEKKAGWKEHDGRMHRLLLAALEDMGADAESRRLCHAAKEAALLKRYQQFVQPILSEECLVRAADALDYCRGRASVMHGQIAANLHLVLHDHWLACGDAQRAADCARSAWEAGVTFASVLAHAHALERDNRLLEALERATEAMRVSHRDDVHPARLLIDQIYVKLGWTAQR